MVGGEVGVAVGALREALLDTVQRPPSKARVTEKVPSSPIPGSTLLKSACQGPLAPLPSPMDEPAEVGLL